jgi:hypothetical protein
MTRRQKAAAAKENAALEARIRAARWDWDASDKAIEAEREAKLAAQLAATAAAPTYDPEAAKLADLAPRAPMRRMTAREDRELAEDLGHIARD